MTIYAQTEIVKDLIQARLKAGATIEFEVSDTSVAELDTDRPLLRYTDSAGTRHEVRCDAIAGCDGFHGIARESMPPGLVSVAERPYPYSWLGILATVPPQHMYGFESSVLMALADGHAREQERDLARDGDARTLRDHQQEHPECAEALDHSHHHPGPYPLDAHAKAPPRAHA